MLTRYMYAILEFSQNFPKSGRPGEGKRVHAANKCTLPHFHFNGSMENSRATGGGVVLEFPLPFNLRIVPNLPANQSGN